MNFNPDFSFKDERFMSAAEKELTLSAWKTFLKHGCQLEHFTERLYHHLSQRCSFIAHYDRHGFYDVYFRTPSEQTFRFLDQFDPNRPAIGAESRDIWWLHNATGSDLSRAMRQVSAPYIPKLRYQFASAERERDLRYAAALAAKHGKQLAHCDSSGGTVQDSASPVSLNPAEPPAQAAKQLSIFASTD